jgi:hypothetical protein
VLGVLFFSPPAALRLLLALPALALPAFLLPVSAAPRLLLPLASLALLPVFLVEDFMGIPSE